MLVYNIVVRIYATFIWLASVNNPKAAQWVKGRRNWRRQLVAALAGTKGSQRIWVHCASYGEFEQGRPLIEGFKQKYPDAVIVLSFFSPSGYEAFKHWPGANVVCYLPLDTKKNAKDFIEIVNPKMAVFIKYEFWINFLWQLRLRNINSYLVSAVFKSHHPFFKWYGGIFRKSLSAFTKLFLQDTASAQLLNSIGIKNHQVCGDTRFDRVMMVKNTAWSDSLLGNFKGSAPLIIAGSTWPGDENMLLEAFAALNNKQVKLILAPHEINDKAQSSTIKKIESLNLSYTLYRGSFDAGARVMILNTIGILAKTYRYADCAYVGGGFNGGLHNLLEPIVFEIPASFYGNDYVKYNEAIELKELGVAIKVANPQELVPVLEKQLFSLELRKEIQIKIQQYFKERVNVTEKLLNEIRL